MRSRILFISGRAEDARRLSGMLHALPLQLEHVPSLQQARNRLHHQEYEVILTEAALPDGNGRTSCTWSANVRMRPR